MYLGIKYLGRFVRAALDTHKIRSRCNADTFRIRILGFLARGAEDGHVSWGFGGMYRCHRGEQRTYQSTHVLLVQKWVLSSTLQLLHLLLCHGHPYPCWSTAHVKREAHQLLCLLVKVELALFFCFGLSPWDPLPWIT